MSLPLDAATLELVPEAVLVATGTGTVLATNVRARTLLALPSDVVGRALREVITLEDDSGRECALPPAPHPTAERTAERRLQVVLPGGRRRSVTAVWRWHGEATVLSVRPARRQASLDRMGGDVVATVSHELRTPLASVKGFTRTLLSRWDRLDDDKKRAMLATIDADADRLTQLLRDLLEVSRIDAGRVRLRLAPLEPTELIDRVVERAVRGEWTGREIGVRVADDLPPMRGDLDRLDQVLTNLVDNALRYGEPPIEIVAYEAEDGVVLEVRDHGPGVPEERRESVFRKFGRVDERQPGNGLGLFIARGLVEAHGGRVTLEDAGPGALLRCWLPAEPAGASPG